MKYLLLSRNYQYYIYTTNKCFNYWGRVFFYFEILTVVILLTKFFNFAINISCHYNIRNYQNIAVVITYPKLAVNNIHQFFSCFFIAEKAVIARAYPITFILKLRPNGNLNSMIYYTLKRYFVLLLQNFLPFLTLFLSLEIKLYDLICVV